MPEITQQQADALLKLLQDTRRLQDEARAQISKLQSDLQQSINRLDNAATQVQQWLR